MKLKGYLTTKAQLVGQLRHGIIEVEKESGNLECTGEIISAMQTEVGAWHECVTESEE